MNLTEQKIKECWDTNTPLKLKHDIISTNRGYTIYQCWDSILGVKDIATGKAIYSKDDWNTKLTKTRLNAIGCQCHIKDGIIVFDNPDTHVYNFINTYFFDKLKETKRI